MSTLRTKSDQLASDLFFYMLTFGDMVDGATLTQSLQIQADSDFEWQKTSFWSSYVANFAQGGGNISDGFLLQITDGSTGRKLQNVPTPSSLITGNSGLPFVSPASHIFMRNSNVIISITNSTGAAQYGVAILLAGVKLYDYKG